ncbi:MAG: CRISPR-associated endoribonuclease Cas6 [Clostridiaceae bacterium]|nr:CRISPR-associated endoribonuclease Cas6 [Clostridiaceae bacterium]
MRIELTFALKEPFITADDRGVVISFLKYALSNKYPELFARLYGANVSKTFSFSTFLPGAKLMGDCYSLSLNTVRVRLSSSERELLVALYNAMMNARFIDYPLPQGNSFRLTRVGYSNTFPTGASTEIIKFLSPLVVRCHDRETNEDEYLDFRSVGFPERLQIIADAYLQKREIEPCAVILRPLSARSTVAICLKRKFLCSFGTFELSASPEAITEFYLAGIGSRRSEGFGLFDIVGRGRGDE